MSEPIASSPWHPMSSAPRVGPVLLRTRWAGRPVALVAKYVSEHGAWCTQSIFGDGVHVIHAAEGWTEIPAFCEG